MVKKREGYKIVVPQEFIDRMAVGLCPVCLKPQNEWKRSITAGRCCCKECTKEYNEKIFWGWPALRRAAIKRDGRCVKCGVIFTCKKELLTSDIEYYWGKYEIILEKVLKREELYADETWDVTLLDMSKYVVDHIKAIALNGPEWDVNNLQTLCIECNKRKTKLDAGMIARERFKERLVSAGQKFLGGEDV